MGKEDVVCIYSGTLLAIKRNKMLSFAEKQMNLKSVIQNEVSEREKQVYSL